MENNVMKFKGECHGTKVSIQLETNSDIYEVLSALKAIVLALGYANQSWRAALEEDLRNNENE
jgi:hypothetical protein